MIVGFGMFVASAAILCARIGETPTDPPVIPDMMAERFDRITEMARDLHRPAAHHGHVIVVRNMAEFNIKAGVY